MCAESTKLSVKWKDTYYSEHNVSIQYTRGCDALSREVTYYKCHVIHSVAKSDERVGMALEVKE